MSERKISSDGCIYVDGSLPAVDLPYFLPGLFVNCFILSALYAYSGSL